MQMKHLAPAAVAIATILTAVCGTAQQPIQPAPPITAKQAREIEKENALPITKFYDTPLPLPEGKPGNLIRAEECSEYLFPFTPPLQPNDMGIKAVRFLYQSKSARGRPVPASGVILIPHGRPPPRGWPVVVWAHGTSGVGRQFAPSLMKDLYYSWASPLPWTMLGYAVVAPDYAGLGTNVPHQYMAMPAQAEDVINAVLAARKALKELGERWVVIGHSQGGCVALYVAETQDKLKDPDYLGAVALAPAGDYEPIVEHIHHTADRGLIGFLAYGIKSVYPDFDYRDFLTPQAIELMPTIERGGLLVTLATFAENVPAGKVLRPDWKQNKPFQEFRKLSVLGERPAYRPVLLIHGEAEEVIPTSTMDALYNRMKRQQSLVEYRKYPGLAHDPVVFGSFRDQARWVQDRFDGKPALGEDRDR